MNSSSLLLDHSEFRDGELLTQTWSRLSIALSCINAYFGTMTTIKCIQLCKDMPMELDGASTWYWAFVALGGLSLGMCTLWSMHFVGMMGLIIGDSVGKSVTIEFDLLLTIFSGLMSSCISSVGIHIVAQHEPAVARTNSAKTATCGGCFVACGAACMHFIGMASQSGHFTTEYDLLCVCAACFMALFAGVVGMYILFDMPELCERRSLDRTAKSILITGAVCTMHYTGMKSATYRFSPKIVSPLPFADFKIRITDFLVTVAVSIFSLVIELVTLDFEDFMEKSHGVTSLSRSMSCTRFGVERIASDADPAEKRQHGRVKI